MEDHIKPLVDAYNDAAEMQAVGMVNDPAIGQVARELQMLQMPTPRPAKGEVTVRIAASSMHIDEIYAAQGTALGRFYGPKNVSKANPARIGSCATGTIVGLGEGAENFKIGDDVIIIPSEYPQAGSWATYQCFDEKWIMHKPDQLSHVEAAAAVMAACVSWGAIGFAKVNAGDNCVVVGASGAIGVMVLQYLKSLNCRVTAVCSGASEEFVRSHGADQVVDYTKDDFGEVFSAGSDPVDAVFDCVGGRDIETSAFRCLKNTGTFVTVVGPRQYIGEEKLSWPAVLKVMSHIGWRMLVTRLTTGPKYSFGAKFPRLVVGDAVEQLLEHNIRMPVPATIPFEIDAIRDAVQKLVTHREKGRTVICFVSD
ncbi:quinone oxidoreductase family protein [Parasedimentitalea maritima]|uniref:Zinc-binding dehydrogenase n=1 Tax=Parasedimentitalea maritima TaxID=2578117 RepID=A0A6A4RCM8_9RHOB|nr:zinc-binding dehydrogenase [Zongyanglinia marina]KAE9627885.1 zinc-binding dehydrogenase [Zongyanglinia marina]